MALIILMICASRMRFGAIEILQIRLDYLHIILMVFNNMTKNIGPASDKAYFSATYSLMSNSLLMLRSLYGPQITTI